MIKIILIAAIAVVGFGIYKAVFKTSDECEKCEGAGYWRGTRGEKEKCDNCGGTGTIPRS